MARERYKEAIGAAKELLTLRPRCPHSFALMGVALSQLPVGLDKARQAFDKALVLNPRSASTVLSYAQVLEARERHKDAVDCLQRFLAIDSDVRVHTALADALVHDKDYTEALRHYHLALSIDPSLEAAKLGVDRVDKLLKGIDPDEEEDDEALEGAQDDSFDDFHR
mmetsp:Transcript_35883/g.83338  ORF Transcript_35883/g.83338 Transcript_35883/m.83338 type:complete len:167 (-) Transcript_35883:95-595(-)